MIAGVALSPSQDNRAQKAVEKLSVDWLGKPSGGRRYELKWTDLIGRRGKYRELTLEESQEMAAEILSLILGLKPILFGTTIDKAMLQEKYPQPFHPKRLALQGLAQRFDMTLQRLDAYGTIVMDEERFKNDSELRRMVHEAREHGFSFRGAIYNPSHASKPERINGTVTFSPSDLSAGIQLADAISGILWRRHERGIVGDLAKIEPFFDRDAHRTYEPILFPL